MFYLKDGGPLPVLVLICVDHVCRSHQSIPVLVACALFYVICSIVDQGEENTGRILYI
jgi:hypothetical protein